MGLYMLMFQPPHGGGLPEISSVTKKPSFLEQIVKADPTRQTAGQGLYFHHFIIYEFMLCSAGECKWVIYMQINGLLCTLNI